MLYSLMALTAGFILDLIVGDPYSFAHPVKAIGRLISKLESVFRKVFSKTDRGERLGGTFLVVSVLVFSAGIPMGILWAAYSIHWGLGVAIESVMCYQLLATKCLKDESMKVFHSLEKGDVAEARHNVSMIVGRDTAVLDETGITKAAVETVAENTSDGSLAPLLYMALGGAVLGFFYKAVNTMDSMVGYKNERYLHFGRTAAKLDDVLNYIPSRVSALLMILVSYFMGMDGKGAYRIWKRDRYNHASPNSAQTEAACAGALQIQLAGDAYYFGELYKKKTIGDDLREVAFSDIKQANRLLYGTAFLTMVLVLLFKGALLFFF